MSSPPSFEHAGSSPMAIGSAARRVSIPDVGAGGRGHDDSTRSSPRPQSDLGDLDLDPADLHQRDQDAMLAQSMARPSTLANASRTRSNTLLDRGGSSSLTGASGAGATQTGDSSQHTPQRHNSSHHNAGGASMSDHGHAQHASISRRRGSMSNQTSAMDHLADDLEIQAHQDDNHSGNSTGNRPPISPGGGGRQSSTGNSVNRPSASRYGNMGSTGTPISLQHSAAAARLYRHHRNVSETSLDSQGGAYIDHRRQPHSLSLGMGPSGTPSRFAAGGAGASVLERAGMVARSPDGYGNSRLATHAVGRRRSSGAGAHSGDEGDHEDALDDFSLGRNYRDGGHDSEPAHSGISSRTARGAAGTRGDLTSADLDEHALALSGDDRDDPRSHLERHDSRQSYRSGGSGNRRRVDDHDAGRHYSNELSRRGSFAGQPEDDICFPAHGAAAEVDLIDMGMGLSHLDEMHHHHDPYSHHHRHHEDPHDQYNSGVAGVLPNFPYPFDFGSLEEFAEREKEGLPIPGAKRRGTRSNGNQNLGVSPPVYGVSSATSRGGPLSSGSEGGFASARRQRKLSESVAPGRYRRKLALFEGAGDDAGSPRGANVGAADREGSTGAGGSMFASILDTKTPLLDKNANGGTAGYGSRGGPTGAGGAAGAGLGSSRPYRFSFYSNALPSTIHARSLAEIPADGQTFEELFVGRSPSPTTAVDEDMSFHHGTAPTAAADPRLTFSPPSGGGTGTHTPNDSSQHGGPNGAAGGTTSGARPSGVPHAAQARAAHARSNLMRSDVDAEANTWWLDVLCPTDQEMKVLSKVFGIHPLTTEDIQMEETREKIELFRNYYFVCFRSFEQDPYSPTYLEPLNMYIIVFREGTLSFHFRGTPHPQNVRRRIKQLKDYINVTSDWISYALIDDITDAFGPLIQNIEYEVDSIDELVLILKEAEQSDMLRRIGTCRKKVMGLLRLMGNKADVVKGLSKRCNENWSVAPKSDIGLYLSDIQDHITTSTQNLTHYEKILSRSHSNYLAQISIEMTDANNQINDVLSKLTALGTVLIPMNLVTGLWGMNVHVPGQSVENLHWFFSILGCLGAIAIGGAWLTYRVFVRTN